MADLCTTPSSSLRYRAVDLTIIEVLTSEAVAFDLLSLKFDNECIAEIFIKPARDTTPRTCSRTYPLKVSVLA